MGADRSPEDEGHKPFIDQVFEDQSGGLRPEPEPAGDETVPARHVASPEPAVVEPVPEPEPEPQPEPEPEPEPEPLELGVGDRSLVDEAMKKSGLIWVTTPDVAAGRAFWHAWAAPTAYLLTGRDEQPDPDWAEGSPVSVLVRSKDNVHRLVSWDAIVTRVDPADEDWEAATTALAAGRLNLRESGTAAQRWAQGGATIYRLRSTGTLGERPGAYSEQSHRAAPVPTPATTADRKPWVLHKRGHSGRPLS